MIRSRYSGNLGNHLFQYFSARLLAEKHGLSLDIEPILGFPKTQDKVSGNKYNNLEKISEQMLSYKDISKRIKNAINFKKGIDFSCFYGFNYRDYYEKNINKAYDWLRISDNIQDNFYDIKDNDLLISVRNGDFIKNKVSLPFEYYQSILESNLINYNNIYIVSDDYNHHFMKNFKKYGPIFIKRNYLEQFKIALKFKYIIASHSTFCWFHVLLNKNINKCFFPVVTTTYSSAWSERMIYKKMFDLRIDKPYMEYVYNVPRLSDFDSLTFDPEQWFADKAGFKNSFLRNNFLKDQTEKTLDYHKVSKYRFLNCLPR